MPISNSKSIVPSKFFGEDRYQKYLNELTSQGTINGEQLTVEERKEAFKSRKNKINFENFVDKILQRKASKEASFQSSSLKSLTVNGGSAPIEKVTKLSTNQFFNNQTNQGFSEKSLIKISSLLDSILETLRESEVNKKKIEILQRRESEKKKRADAESRLERGFKLVGKVVEKIVAPVKSIIDKILDFFINIIIGRSLIKLLDWFGDPKNREKVNSLIRFFGDHWPKLLALYITFGTSFGKFARGLVSLVVKSTTKLVAVTAALAAKAIGGKFGGRLGKFASFVGGPRGKLVGVGIEAAAAVGGTLFLSKQLEKFSGIEEKPQKVSGYSGGGFVLPKFKFPSLGGSSFPNIFDMFNSSGYVSGDKGVDKVPAMLSDGEFVMSRGAVEKYGVDTLEAMNSSGGGTNKPKVMSGTTFAAGGGFVGKASKHLKHDEALSSLSEGKNDYVKPGGNSAATRTPWSMINPQTLLHSYVDSVGQPTIGWGSRYYDSILNGKKPVKRGDTITKSQADQILNVNIMNLAKTYSQKIPTWGRMSDDQKAGILLVGYNAPYGPIGAYKNLTSSLQSGNMIAAAKNVQRGGPSAARLEIERKLILNGPKDLSKCPAIKQKEKKSEKIEKNNPNILQRFQSGISSMFSGMMGATKPKQDTQQPKEKYGKGGYAPRMNQFTSAKQKAGNQIKPLRKSKSNTDLLQTLNMSSPTKNVVPSSSNIPYFSVTSGGTNYKKETLGITV